MKLLSCLLLLVAYLQLSEAWVIRLQGNKKHKDKTPVTETFFSREAKNDCHTLSDSLTSKGVLSFHFCTIQMYGCEIAFFDKQFCLGDRIGHSGGRGYSWQKYPVSKKGSKMKSFRISGCRADIPGVEKGKFDTFRIADC